MSYRVYATMAMAGLAAVSNSQVFYVSATLGDWTHIFEVDANTYQTVDLGRTIAYLGTSLERMDDGRLLGTGYSDPFTFPHELYDYEAMPGVIVAPVENPLLAEFRLAEHGDELYGITSRTSNLESRFYEIDTATGDLTLRWQLNTHFLQELAIDEAGNAYTLSPESTGARTLHRVDMLTGNLVEIGSTALAVGLDFMPDGTLRGLTNTGQIVTIDPLTGAFVVDAELNLVLGGFIPRDVTFVVPEPATVFILLGGLALVCSKRLRK